VRKHYDVTGPVRRLTQLRERRTALAPLDHLIDFDSFQIEFSSEGLVLVATRYRFDGVVGDVERFEYDVQRRVIGTVKTDGAGAPLSSCTVEYEADGKTSVTRNAGGEAIHRHVNELEGERPLVLASFRADGTPLTRKEFEYRDGELVGSIGTYWGALGGVSHRWVTQYDEFERILRTRGEKADGSPLGDGKYKYNYGDGGRLWKLWTFSDFEEKAQSVETYTYVDDERGNWIERRGVHVWRSDNRKTTNLTTGELLYED
jgi:hypothetical protein